MSWYHAGPAAGTLTAVLLTALLACEQPGRVGGPIASADSAGVRIVTVDERALDVRALEPEPVLSVGVPDDPPEEAFGYVAGAVLLADGGVAVADAFGLRIALFDRAGRHVRSLGRRGSGPGEFESIVGFGRYRGDSLFAGDLGARRVTVIDPRSGDARVLRTEAGLPGVAGAVAEASCCRLIGATRQGAFLVVGPEWSPTEGPEPRWGRVVAGELPTEGGIPRVLTELQGAEYRASPPGFPRPSTTLHFGNALAVAATRDGFAATDGRSFEVRIFDGLGALTTVARVARARMPVGEQERRSTRAYYDSLAVRAGGDLRGSGLEWVADRPFADSIPAYTQVLQDRGGRLWAGFPTSGRRAGPMVFDVFEESGDYRWSVEIPAGSTLLDAADESVLLRRVDDLGVQRVLLHRLTERR